MMGTRRLQKEAKALKKNWGQDLIRVRSTCVALDGVVHPVSLATPQATPTPDNLFEFHFVVEGPPDTPYEGGFYHGMLRFPPDYPMKVSWERL